MSTLTIFISIVLVSFLLSFLISSAFSRSKNFSRLCRYTIATLFGLFVICALALADYQTMHELRVLMFQILALTFGGAFMGAALACAMGRVAKKSS
jgi:hypothetical protein